MLFPVRRNESMRSRALAVGLIGAHAHRQSASGLRAALCRRDVREIFFEIYLRELAALRARSAPRQR